MGNTQSIEASRYTFDNPVVGDARERTYDMSQKKVYIIDSAESVEAAKAYLNNINIVYVDCEGDSFGHRDSRLGLVQIAISRECCFLFDVIKFPECCKFLKILMESNDVRKVFHDCSGDSAALYNAGRIMLRNVDDTQIAQKVIDGFSTGFVSTETGCSLKELYTNLLNRSFPQANHRPNEPNVNRWLSRPMNANMIKYAAIDVLILPELFNIQKSEIEHSQRYQELVEEQLNVKRRSLVTRNRDGEERELLQESTSLRNLVIGVGATAAVAFTLMSMANRNSDNRR